MRVASSSFRLEGGTYRFITNETIVDSGSFKKNISTICKFTQRGGKLSKASKDLLKRLDFVVLEQRKF